MPNDKINLESDGDPNTVYEDTDVHPKFGFIPESHTINEPQPDEPDAQERK